MQVGSPCLPRPPKFAWHHRMFGLTQRHGIPKYIFTSPNSVSAGHKEGDAGEFGWCALSAPGRHHALYELTSWHVSEATGGKFISSLISLSTPNWQKFASIQSITSVLHERTLGPNPPRDHVRITHCLSRGDTERERGIVGGMIGGEIPKF